MDIGRVSMLNNIDMVGFSIEACQLTDKFSFVCGYCPGTNFESLVHIGMSKEELFEIVTLGLVGHDLSDDLRRKLHIKVALKNNILGLYDEKSALPAIMPGLYYEVFVRQLAIVLCQNIGPQFRTIIEWTTHDYSWVGEPFQVLLRMPDIGHDERILVKFITRDSICGNLNGLQNYFSNPYHSLPRNQIITRDIDDAYVKIFKMIKAADPSITMLYKLIDTIINENQDNPEMAPVLIKFLCGIRKAKESHIFSNRTTSHGPKNMTCLWRDGQVGICWQRAGTDKTDSPFLFSRGYIVLRSTAVDGYPSNKLVGPF